MVRASYRHAVRWIAFNDEGAERDLETISQAVTVLLVADIFGAEPERVAKDVLRVREKGEDL
jgi:hypothetical protein